CAASVQHHIGSLYVCGQEIQSAATCAGTLSKLLTTRISRSMRLSTTSFNGSSGAATLLSSMTGTFFGMSCATTSKDLSASSEIRSCLLSELTSLMCNSQSFTLNSSKIRKASPMVGST